MEPIGAKTDVDTIDEVVKLYESSIAQRVTAAKKDGQVTPEPDLRNREFGQMSASRFSSKDTGVVLDVRKKVLVGMLYDRLKSVQSQNKLDEVFRIVRDPMLDGAMIWLGMNGGLNGVSKERFVEGYDATIGVYARRLPAYLRPLTLLEIISKEPISVQNLNESSSYFPQKLFPRAKKPDTKKDIEHEISAQLPDIFSDEVISAMNLVDRFIERGKGNQSYSRFGKFILPQGRYVWKQRDGSADELQSLRYQEIKRQVYQAMGEYLVLTGTTVFDKGINPKAIKSDLVLTPSEYRNVIGAIRNYAKNQILHVWKESQGTKVIETPLARLTKLSAQQAGNDLWIYDSYHCSFERLKMDSPYKDTTSPLPYLLAILSNANKSASR